MLIGTIYAMNTKMMMVRATLFEMLNAKGSLLEVLRAKAKPDETVIRLISLLCIRGMSVLRARHATAKPARVAGKDLAAAARV